MKDYEKPLLDVIMICGDVITGSCSDDTYECDEETPVICIWGD